MKIEQRQFGITEISERVAGIDGDGEALHIVFVTFLSEEVLSPALRPEDVDALIEALQEARRLQSGIPATIVTDAPAPKRKPAGLIDRDGDRWNPDVNGSWNLGSGAAYDWPRERVEREYGPVQEVWE